MPSPLGMLIAYDGDGNVVATLDHLVVRDDAGRAVGLLDFQAYEAAGGKFRLTPDRPDGVWDVPNAAGSGAWPEWLGGRAHDFRVQMAGAKINGLVHLDSGYKRDRAKIEKAIADRIAQANGEPADIRDLVGGIGKPLRLDGTGRTQRPDVGTRPGKRVGQQP